MVQALGLAQRRSPLHSLRIDFVNVKHKENVKLHDRNEGFTRASDP